MFRPDTHRCRGGGRPPRLAAVVLRSSLVVLAALAGTRPATAGAIAPAAAERAPATATALLARFARIEGLSARYREEKRMALLAEPLVAEGELYYARPNRMVRRQRTPEPSTVLLEGDRLVVAAGGQRQELDLAAQPVVRMFVDSVRWVLAGDAPRLRDLYDVTYTVREDGGWRLRLSPRKKPLVDMIDHMTIEGRDVVLERIRIVERGGDATVMTFEKVDPDRRFTETEIARIFRVP